MKEKKEEETEEKGPVRKYQRREFIKNTAKIGAGAALYGAAGYGIGRGYRWGRDTYRKDVKPYVDKGKEVINKGEETKDRLGNWWNKYFNKDKYEREQEKEKLERENKAKEPEEMSRRGFLSKYFHLFDEHPVTTGTVTGATLGAVVSGLKLYPQYLEKKKVAKLRDEHIELMNENAKNKETIREYGERIKILEEYRENLEKSKDPKIKRELENVYKVLNMSEKDSSGLEEKIKADQLKAPLSMLLSGIGLIIGFILINGGDYTGFSVLSQDSISTSDFLGIIIIFTSLVLIIIGGLRLRKIRKTEKINQILKKRKSKKKIN
jgi:hypothetical protein